MQEVAHFPATFANHGNNNHVGTDMASHHAQQSALADTAASEYPHALTLRDGHDTVNSADTCFEQLIQRRTTQRIYRW